MSFTMRSMEKILSKFISEGISFLFFCRVATYRIGDRIGSHSSMLPAEGTEPIQDVCMSIIISPMTLNFIHIYCVDHQSYTLKMPMPLRKNVRKNGRIEHNMGPSTISLRS